MNSPPRIFRSAIQMLLITLVSLMLYGCSQEPAPNTDNTESSGPRIGLEFDYPPEWESTLSDAQTNTAFTTTIPNHHAANSDNVTEVFINPSGTVLAMQFPSPHKPSAPVRQEYLEVYQEPWQGKLSPGEAWAQALAEYPGTAEITVVDGTPVLVGKPHSDETDQNPAHIQYVDDGTYVEIFGNDDSDLLVDIARTMMKE